MIQYRDPPHFLKALKTTTTPKRLMWLDCASRSQYDKGMWVDRWDCAALGSTHYASKTNNRIDTMEAYYFPELLWQAVDKYCTSQRRVVLFAYDLGYQLRVSQMLVQLPKLGWRLDKIVLERTASWALLRNGKRTLMCCDLQSWAPVELAKLAHDINPGLGAAFRAEAGDQYKAMQCKMKAATVRDAVLQIFNWIEGENLGPFRPTGSGQSYSGYRRRFISGRLLVHDDTQRLELERQAMWTGRCEAWRHGKLTGGPFVEYDMQAAYCTIAAECEVPTVARRVVSQPSTQRLTRLLQQYAILAECTVTTDVPVVPTRMGDRTVWPVGTFRTVLWDPELQLALDYASKVQVDRIWLYERGPALQDFARWVLDGMQGQTQVYGLVPQRVLKHWSRCLVGRMGLRFRAWEKFGWQHPPDLRLVTYVDIEEGTSTDMLIAGNDRLILSDMMESTESLPQVPAWIMSECRARLWRAMVTYGLDRITYVDTDSMILNMESGYYTPVPGYALEANGWTVKGTYKSMTIHGPRNLVCETDRRVSGLPLTARQVAPLEFSGKVMRSIKESMRAGQLDCVASIPRTFVLDAPDLRRNHLPNGQTAPFEVQLPTEGIE